MSLGPSASPHGRDARATETAAHTTDTLLATLIEKLPKKDSVFLTGGRVVHFDAPVLRLHFDREHADAGLHTKQQRNALSKLMAEVLGKPIALEVEVDVPEPTTLARDPEPARPRVVIPNLDDVEPDEAPITADYSEFAAHPLVKALLETFDGRITRVD